MKSRLFNNFCVLYFTLFFGMFFGGLFFDTFSPAFLMNTVGIWTILYFLIHCMFVEGTLLVVLLIVSLLVTITICCAIILCMLKKKIGYLILSIEFFVEFGFAIFLVVNIPTIESIIGLLLKALGVVLCVLWLKRNKNMVTSL